MRERRWMGGLLTVLGCALWASSAGAAQEKAAKTIPATPILPVVQEAVAAARETGDAADQAIEAFEKARQEWSDSYRAAKSNEERLELRNSQPDAKKVGETLQGIADANPGTDLAAKSLAWMASNLRDQNAIETLLTDHSDSVRLADLCLPLAFSEGEQNEQHLRDLAEKSPHEVVRGKACYFLAYRLQQAKRMEEAAVLYKKVIAEYPGLEDSRMGSLNDRAKGAINEIENLAVGKVAPDVEGVDTDGVPFKLSDYRGKVVMLDFWGHW